MELRAAVTRVVVGSLAAVALGQPALVRRAVDDAAPVRSGAAPARTAADSVVRVSTAAGTVTITVAVPRDTGRRGLGRSGTDLVAAYVRAGWPPAPADGAPADGAPADGAPDDDARLVIGHVLVVVLPDPLDSHLDWAFDSEVESVRRAFETTGYVLDRFWLPWQAAADGAQAAAAARDTSRRATPGVLLFRHAEAPDSVALVYMVGETPTGGIHAAAFAAALEDRRTLLRTRVLPVDAARASRDTLRIVGPTFSGSAPSLRSALQAAQARRVIGPVHVVSGGATAPGNAALLRTADGGDPARRITFHATVNPVDRLRRHVEAALTNGLGIEPREIAYLSESGTQYGRSLEPTVPVAPRDTALQIPFPMNVSRLRREYARYVQPGDTSGSAQTSLTRIDWRDPASVAESPAPLSELTAPTIERTIADIEQTLVLHHIRAVGILATDVRDRLFLASIVRQRLRDVKVFFIGSHSLYLRPELNAQLRGALVVSTYPLFLENQFWDLTYHRRERLVFTSDASEGTYNAALAQLRRTEAMTDYTMPLQQTGALVPPVWITSVGASSLLPVVADPGGHTPTSAAYVLTRPDIVSRDQAEPTARHLQIQSGLLALALGAALAVALYWNFRDFDDRTVISDAAPGATPGATSDATRASGWAGGARRALEWHRESWVIFRFVAILCAFAPICLVLLRPQAHGTPPSRFALGLIVGLMLVSGVGIAWHYVGVRRAVHRDTAPGAAADPAQPGTTATPATPATAEPPQRRRLRDAWRERARRLADTRLAAQVRRHWDRQWWQHASIHALAFVYLLVTAVFILQVGNLDLPLASMFFLRALALDSGISPVIPLLVGALLLVAWCTWHLGRVTMLGDLSAFEAACRDGRIDASRIVVQSQLGSPGRFEEAVTDVRKGLLSLLPGRHALGVLIGLLFFGVWVLVEFDRSLETILLGTLGGWRWIPGSFDLLFRFLLIAAITLSAWTLYRLLLVWNALRACLRNVEAMPLAAAFARLPGSIAGLTRFTPFNAPSSPAVDLTIDRAAESLWRELRRQCVPSYASEHVRRLGTMPPVAFMLRAPHGSLDPSVAEPLVALHEALCEGATRDAVRLTVEDPVAGDAKDRAGQRPPRSWPEVAQDLVALYVIDYVEWVVRHLRHLAVSVVVSLAMTTILLASYPFEPESLVQLLFFGLMAATVVSIVSLLFQMSRDVTMSRITRTVPGQVNWDTQLVFNLAVVGAVPMLTLLSAQFPQVREFLFFWVTPVLSALGKG